MKIFKYLIIFLAVQFTVSCSKDFLSVPPPGQLTEDTYFTSDQSIDNALNAVYASIDWRYFRLGTMYFTTHELCADDLISGSGNDAAFSRFSSFDHTSSEIYIERMYDRWYDYINRCNQALRLAEKISDPAHKAQYIAQAKYFRAYYHFDLMNVFGDIVIRDHVPSISEFNVPRTTMDDVYAFVIKDLAEAITDLPTRQEWGTANLGRITKGTALGLLSRIYLYKRDYANAMKYSGDVITSGEYSLDQSYRNLFSKDGKYSVESMMPGHYIYMNIAGRVRNPYVEMQGIPSGPASASSTVIGSNYITVSDNIVNAYDTGDPRKKASIFVKGVDSIVNAAGTGNININWRTSSQYANKKTIWPGPTWPTTSGAEGYLSSELNLPFMRYAEILLNYAEAANEAGNSVEALAKLEIVRKRARGNVDYDPSSTTGANVLPTITVTDKVSLRHLIWNERRVELAFEGHRWFDLLRYEAVEPGYIANIMTNLGRTHFDASKHLRIPLPATRVLNSNNVLIQNPNW